MKHRIQLTVNGEFREVEAEPRQTLLDILRDEFKLVRTKEGCGVGECGSCAVSMDRKTVNSCLVLATDADGKDIVTIEGLTRNSDEPEFHPLMEAFIDQGAMRASFASPGRKPRHEFFTFCHLCPGHCSVRAVVEEGKVVDVAPDLESGLPSESCPLKKGRFSIPEILSHRDRLLYPQKRTGARGEGTWERISWDEALDTIAEKFKHYKETFGPEAVALGLGEPKGLEFAFAQRFASVFGTPNVVTPGWCCGVPTGQASTFTCGWNVVPDEDDLPKLLVLWGINLIQTSGGMRRESLEAVLEGGGKLVVIDPRRIDLAGVADLWLRVRPGSDGALAMGALKIMIEEKLYDEEMVSQWTVGFEKLAEHVKTFSLEEVERVTWIPRQQIEQFARLYAELKPAVLHWGNGLDQFTNSFQTGRAISILRALGGNLNIPGGERFLVPAPFTRPGRFFLLKQHPRHPKRTLGDKFKVAERSAFIPPHILIKMILEEEPYPIKAAMFILTNPMVSYPNSKRIYQALTRLDFTVVSELFMTPTAALADIILPAAWGMEHEEVGYWPGWYESIRAYPKVVDPPGECWADTKIINELAKRLGMREHFWDEDEDALDVMLEPAGIKYQEFKEMRVLAAKKVKERHAYRTASGKVEIYSEQLKKMGYSPIPTWEEMVVFPESDEAYPLLLTNGKEEAYMLSSYKSVSAIRSMRPEPTAELNPDTAEKLGIKQGEWAYIETKEGKIKQRISLNHHLDPRVVIASFGWWFPEKPSSLYGWEESNINILISSGPEHDPVTGAVQMRGVPCKVYPV